MSEDFNPLEGEHITVAEIIAAVCFVIGFGLLVFAFGGLA